MVFSFINKFKGTLLINPVIFSKTFLFNNIIYPAVNKNKIIGNMRVNTFKRFSINVGMEYNIPNIRTTRISKYLLNITIAAADDLVPNFENLYHFTTPPDKDPGRNVE